MAAPTTALSQGYSQKAYAACFILLLQNCLTFIVIRMTRDIGPDEPKYLTTWSIVVSEVLKLVICAVLAYREQQDSATGGLPAVHGNQKEAGPVEISRAVLDKVFGRSFLYISVPGILYCVQNNLVFYALSNLEAVVFSLTSQFKIITTAFFSVLILGRKLSRVQWGSLVLLTVGICFVQYDSSTAPAEDGKSFFESNSFSGLLACFALTCTSAVAGVYFEKIVKGLASGPASIWVSNIQLAIFGSVSGFAIVYTQDWEEFVRLPLFYGFTPLVWGAILLHVAGGLIVAAVVKYADNILKSFATSFSMILTSLISYFWLGLDLSFIFILGVGQVVVATHLFSNFPPAA